MTLRQGLEMVESAMDNYTDQPSIQQVVQPTHTPSSNDTNTLRGIFGNSASARNTLIRHPSPIYVDADAQK
jgi:hypothetical protein